MNRPEQQLQISIADWLRVAAPDLLWWHCPNGGRRTKAEAGLFKAMGVRPGVPDLCFLLPGGISGFIELKADRGVPNVNQIKFREQAIRLGAYYACCNTINAVEQALRLWGVKLRIAA